MGTSSSAYELIHERAKGLELHFKFSYSLLKPLDN